MNCHNILKILLMFVIVRDHTACLCFFALSSNGSNKAYGWHESTKIHIRCCCQSLLGVDFRAAQQPLCHQWWWYGPNVFEVLLHEEHLHTGNHLQSGVFSLDCYYCITGQGLSYSLVICLMLLTSSLRTGSKPTERQHLHTLSMISKWGTAWLCDCCHSARSFLCLHYIGQSSLMHI